MKKSLLFYLLIVTFSLQIGCSVADDIRDTADALECAALIESLDEDNDTCAEVIADINRIESNCGEFLSESSMELIATIRANCTDN